MNKQIEKAIETFKVNLGLTKEELDLPLPDGEEEQIKEWIVFQELAISALTQQLNNGWIPVSERLPEDDESIRVYATIRYKENGYIFTDRLRWFFGKFKWFNGSKLSHKYEVVAWMPDVAPEPFTQPTKSSE
jgi:hypothetical protein